MRGTGEGGSGGAACCVSCRRASGVAAAAASLPRSTAHPVHCSTASCGQRAEHQALHADGHGLGYMRNAHARTHAHVHMCMCMRSLLGCMGM